MAAAFAVACRSSEPEPKGGGFEDVRAILDQAEGAQSELAWSEGEGLPEGFGEGFQVPEDVYGTSGLEHLLQRQPGKQPREDGVPAEEVESAAAGSEPESVFSGNPYLLFGPRIIPHANGTITKVYPLPPGKGKQLTDLMSVLKPFPVSIFENIGELPPDIEPIPEVDETQPLEDVVKVVLLPNWDQELYSNPEAYPPVSPKPVDIADWLVVTASEERMWDVEGFLRVFAAGVPQIELEATILEFTETDELDIGITPFVSPDGVEPTLDLRPGQSSDEVLLESFFMNFPNKTDVAESMLSLRSIQGSFVFQAIIQAVKNWENVQIKSQPKIAVREGGTASIENTADIPFYGFSGITATGGFQATLQVKEIGTKMFVVPRVVHDTVALDINIEASQQIGTLVSFVTEGGGELSVPIVARRKARTIVYLRPGEAVMLGGLDSERIVKEESKVPILGDIPLIGYLFRSTFTRKEVTRVMFIISPRILQAAELDSEY